MLTLDKKRHELVVALEQLSEAVQAQKHQFLVPADRVRNLERLYRDAHESYIELFKMCIAHLKPQTMNTPEQRKQRHELVIALEQLIDAHAQKQAE